MLCMYVYVGVNYSQHTSRMSVIYIIELGNCLGELGPPFAARSLSVAHAGCRFQDCHPTF